VEVRRTVFEELSQREKQGDEEARAWVQHFQSVGEKLQVRTALPMVQTQNG